MKAALYARVSTDDKGQDPANQLAQLRRWARQQGWRIVAEYVDYSTGKNGDRAAFREMWRAAERHHFEVLLFWSLDRLSREGVLKTLLYLERLAAAGVKFRSYQEPYLNSLGPFGDAVVAILAAIAKTERERLSARTKAGLERARARGVRLGRPRSKVDVKKARALRKQGHTMREIGTELGISPALACLTLKGARQ